MIAQWRTGSSMWWWITPLFITSWLSLILPTLGNNFMVLFPYRSALVLLGDQLYAARKAYLPSVLLALFFHHPWNIIILELLILLPMLLLMINRWYLRIRFKHWLLILLMARWEFLREVRVKFQLGSFCRIACITVLKEKGKIYWLSGSRIFAGERGMQVRMRH